MEKESQPESMTTVNIKPEYPPSEVYSSEPPPAYHKPQSSTVQIAKIVAVTVVLCSVILGSFLLASAYVTANASCRQLEQELELLSEAADRFQSVPQPEALIQDEPIAIKRHVEPLHAEEIQKATKEIETNSIDNDSDNSDGNNSSESSSDTSDETNEDKTPIHIKLPLQLDLDDLAGAILDKNQKSKMNCIVEKKKAEEVVDHQPKTIRLPFGVNVTTDPRFERLSGERMVIICESGSLQRSQPPPQRQEDDDDQEEDTIMIQPVMIPIPQTPFQTHMPQQMVPVMPPRPAMPPMRPPMHPMETMRPPLPPVMHTQIQMQVQPQAQAVPEQPSNDFPPNPILHHIVQQIVAQKIMENQRAREEQLRQQQLQQIHQQQLQQQQQQMQNQQTLQLQAQQTSDNQESEEVRVPHRFHMPQAVPMQALPEEVLTQLNRLPNRDVIVAVSESDSEEAAPQEIRFVQEQRQNANEMNGRQSFTRGLPVDIPVAMMPQDHTEQEQEQQATASDEPRPHYVQPRSVRSVDAVLGKRVKRCACDCAC